MSILKNAYHMHMHGLLDNVFIMSQQTLIMSPFPLTWVELMKLKIDRFDDKIGICVFKTNLKFPITNAFRRLLKQSCYNK